MNDIAITIRSIQHYLYCPHRWGLIEIGGCWAENYYVTKANLLHQRVHDPERQYVKKNRKVFTGVKVYNDLPEYNIYGVTDCIEAVEESDGITIRGENGKFGLTIVEYKPTQPVKSDYNEDDLMQVFAQKLCVDHIFGGNAKGELYYADVKKRIKLPLQENFHEYDNILKELLGGMRKCLTKGIIPKVNNRQKCQGCSFKDLCMPKLKLHKGIRAAIMEDANEETP